jgi:asparagine synthase (glutamine-hydrolysing)
MCGICGIINFNSDLIHEDRIRKMMGIMKHRGPDDEGLFIEDNIGLGFVRLSIIDLSQAGHQPFFSADGRYVMVFNGEIYNYIELREELQECGIQFNTKTDSEVLLASFIQWGEDCLNHFNGMWAFIIFDRYNKKIFGARDRYGIKPLYYTITSDFFAFSSEIPSLLATLKNKPEPDNQTIFDYLVFNRTDQTEDTFFKDIKKLQHGCSFNLEKSTFKISKWYQLRDKVRNPFIDPGEFRELFNSSIGMRLRSDVPVGVCLSGGIDSSSITSVLVDDFGKNDLNTFSAVYGEKEVGDESKYIKLFNKKLHNMYFTTPTGEGLLSDLTAFINCHAEPIPSTSPYAQYKVMELAQKHVVVTLDGQGADEELAGYHYFFGFYFKDLLRSWQLKTLLREVWNYTIKHKSLFGLKSFLYFALPQKMRTGVRVKEKGYLSKSFVKEYGYANNVVDNIYGAHTLNDALIDHFEFKLEHLLKWEDRNSMHFSIEARVPFLDYRIVERVLATPTNLVIQKGINKFLLREAMKGTLVEDIRLRRDKMGFETPQNNWFRSKIWQNEIQGIISSNEFLKRGIFDSAKVSKVYQDHLSGKINIGNEIWKIVNLEHWFRMFID